MENLIQQLKEAGVGKVLKNEPLSKHTTIKIGGPADILIEPDSIESLKKVLKIVKENDAAWTTIGRGSNLLVSDQGIEGVVIKLGKGTDHLEEKGEEILVGGGYSLVKLSTIMSRKGMAGLEFASGIPGSVGGAVYMNAGAHGSDMSQILAKAHVLYDDGSIEWLAAEDMEFSYRTSILQKKPGICLEAVLHLKQGDRESITDIMQKNKDYRKETQPWNHPCCGSVFRNPLPNYAGELIESSGLKGKAVGGAQISEMHANFIVNTGDAKAQDVIDLIEIVKKTIKENYDIDMETEVEMLGR
ncbi:UDP-N-acetylmuramate dehydrogenase [Pseudalkalibacillus salsuginis]|uniref:UDP-N-acetylmuramate dehydrogenase n=1 Tax=Pseudalkalibacillus salsuginis TaxID=2910972 RepID=UPI001F1FF43C|nr:UDP-N-acetylmuramate dehydrogenase [Pseudalkalibacillus salsuginis]MCF6410471.1 UDP-N-acetylmuramate dehydrogenase [Pseudalkalibacillus salsuginis]